MNDEDDDQPEDWNVLPVGTCIYAPVDKEVVLEFPTVDDAVYFHEFLRSWCAGEIRLEVVKE